MRGFKAAKGAAKTTVFQKFKTCGQLREKDLPPEERLARAVELRDVIAGRALLIVNGDAAAAEAAGGGVHLPAAAAALDGQPPRPFGRSTHDDDELARAIADGVDYVVFGPAYPTVSKPGHQGAGVEAVHHAARMCRPTPLFAIGGVTTSHVPELIHAGAWGVAVCGAILSASNPQRIAEALTLALNVSTGSS